MHSKKDSTASPKNSSEQEEFFALNHIINGDCLSVIKDMPSNLADLVIADPPYFQVCGDFDFGVFKTRTSYINWCKDWLSECKRVLKPTGSLILWGGGW